MLGLGTSSVLAADFKTTIGNFGSPIGIGTHPVDTIIFNWSTNLTSGSVSESNLTHWSYELLNGGSSVYTETIILGGVVQPIGGVTRTLGDLLFSFDLDTPILFGYIGFNNDLNALQDGAATGVTYNIYGNIFLNINRYEDGNLTIGGGASGFSRTTEVVAPSATTPEPSSILGLVAVGSLAAFSLKRKR